MQIEVSELRKARLNREDVLIVKLARSVSAEVAGQIKAAVQIATDHEKVLVISPDIALEIAGPYPKVVD
jgi:hypothetical protein